MSDGAAKDNKMGDFSTGIATWAKESFNASIIIGSDGIPISYESLDKGKPITTALHTLHKIRETATDAVKKDKADTLTDEDSK